MTCRRMGMRECCLPLAAAGDTCYTDAGWAKDKNEILIAGMCGGVQLPWGRQYYTGDVGLPASVTTTRHLQHSAVLI